MSQLTNKCSEISRQEVYPPRVQALNFFICLCYKVLSNFTTYEKALISIIPELLGQTEQIFPPQKGFWSELDATPCVFDENWTHDSYLPPGPS